MQLREELAHRQKAMFANEPGDLNRQRHERDEIHGAEQAKKHPARTAKRRRWMTDHPSTFLLEELQRLEGEHRVLVPQGHDPIVIGVFGKFAAQQPVAQAASFVALEIVDELAHQLRPSRGTRPDAVPFKGRKHVAAVVVFHCR